MLDASLGAELDQPCTPDVLILPSDLAPFAKSVAADKPARSGDGNKPAESGAANTAARLGAGDERLVMGNVVCINPGRLAKDKSGGTFAKLQVWTSVLSCPVFLPHLFLHVAGIWFHQQSCVSRKAVSHAKLFLMQSCISILAHLCMQR
jgi:hypothetical protein